MLEILNLDKKEVIAIDGISNQEFSQVINYGPFKLSFELGWWDLLFLLLCFFLLFFSFPQFVENVRSADVCENV